MKRYTTTSPEETIALGHSLGNALPGGSVVCFFGDLAAGKTTFIKGLASGALGSSYDDVNSPTFVYLNIYGEERKIYHFDLYRLDNSDDFLAKGFDEYLHCGEDICCIEWSEKIKDLLPEGYISVTMVHSGDGARTITIEGT
ncbi:MAG: tRNA (adenosine(37)-N6)-threonylcarbamoyltransferase complex ATPase subunit type 1 TsaE [Waddliaceae bacterium]|jgi:tRNA threonylcarbamoyladenosine biosynthesis protein TsaE|nr:tRNA (adenosine(37)-N6)-threonylcarbamoyltransferase complex ATPase subunit type 1 TsaE [Waddliaceae bacterium]MBT3578879.1 tRNA (adenosine(37)-N6)-threonylcarbamoyltransferase complex ATPase subunit type 1 TsaE [Waddliaceae bacterium]MBT4445045.1 tRNA (adenosine(37)-N6)-threonylcarbamoyltransferase complex ATPase subunit type 1 TsaE [Waddliaceae bacterium]MBT6929053.1 tRNA (adenosine(37)-N6)-threonylcarbamoyltransferase complex ATPase subunit type 1 TsaE [Waddliaceae bacterium]MBT7264052.1 